MDTDIWTYIEYIEGHNQNINCNFRKICQCTILGQFSTTHIENKIYVYLYSWLYLTLFYIFRDFSNWFGCYNDVTYFLYFIKHSLFKWFAYNFTIASEKLFLALNFGICRAVMISKAIFWFWAKCEMVNEYHRTACKVSLERFEGKSFN